MVADDEVADATDDDAERHAGRGGVHHLPERQPALPHLRQGEEDGAGEPAEQRDAALPDLENVEDVVVVAGVVDDVREAGADDGADGRPGEQGVDVVGADPPLLGRRQHEPGAEQEAHRDPDPVGRDR